MESNPAITHDEISQRAYQIWEQNGQRAGEEKEHWLQAERELHQSPAQRDERDRSRCGSVEPSQSGHAKQIAPHSSDYVHPGVTTDSLHHHRTK